MQMKQLIPATLFGLLLASPFAIAEEAHHPDSETAPAENSATPENAPSGAETQPAAPGGMGGSGMMGGQSGESAGMMGGGMMNMMGGQPGQRSGMMEGGGMLGMMHGGKGGGKGGGMGMMGYGGNGHGMGGRYRKLMGRLDLLEARMAKMDTMLERLLER